MHALIEIDNLSDTGRRKDFGGAIPPDLSHKNPPMAWVPVKERGVRPAPASSLTHSVARAEDVVTRDGVNEGWKEVALPRESTLARTRSLEREALRSQWDALPAYLKGPYRHLLESANLLLDEGDDASAIELIKAAEANSEIAKDSVKQALFNTTKKAFATALEALTQLP